jgi:hypothetical protein
MHDLDRPFSSIRTSSGDSKRFKRTETWSFFIGHIPELELLIPEKFPRPLRIRR